MTMAFGENGSMKRSRLGSEKGHIAAEKASGLDEGKAGGGGREGGSFAGVGAAKGLVGGADMARGR